MKSSPKTTAQRNKCESIRKALEDAEAALLEVETEYKIGVAKDLSEENLAKIRLRKQIAQQKVDDQRLRLQLAEEALAQAASDDQVANERRVSKEIDALVKERLRLAEDISFHLARAGESYAQIKAQDAEIDQWQKDKLIQDWGSMPYKTQAHLEWGLETAGLLEDSVKKTALHGTSYIDLMRENCTHISQSRKHNLEETA